MLVSFFFQCFIRLGLIVVSTCEYSNDCEWRIGIHNSLERMRQRDDQNMSFGHQPVRLHPGPQKIGQDERSESGNLGSIGRGFANFFQRASAKIRRSLGKFG